MRKIFTVLVLLLNFYFSKAQIDTSGKAVKLAELSLDDLMNVKVVTSTGFQQTAAEAPSTILVITSQQIRERGYEQLEDALRDVPGIDMVHLNGYAPTIFYFRGLYGVENLRTLLMIDGIPENNIAGTNDMAGPAYSLHNIDRIEIIWGPASALYGNNAFGGVINMITRKGVDINGLQLERGTGTLNTSFEKAAYGINKSGFDISFSASLYKTDGPRFTNRDPNYTGSYVDNAWGAYVNIAYTYKKFKTTLGGRAFETPMGWGTLFNSPTKFLGLPPQGNGNQGTIGILSSNFRGEKPGLEEPFSRTVFLQTEYTASPRLSVLARAQYRQTGISDKSYIYITVDGANLFRLPFTQTANRTEAEISANYSIKEIHKFSAGIQFYQDNLERDSMARSGNRGTNFDNTQYTVDGRFKVSGLYTTFKERYFSIWNTFGSYLQYSLATKLLGKTYFTLGARYDNSNIYSTSPSPRVAVVNQPNDKWTFKMLYGNAFRAPVISEKLTADRLNKPIEPEKINTYEGNIIYKPSNKYLLQVNGFYNHLSDVILQTQVVSLVQSTSVGTADIEGMEAKTDIVLTKHISAFANFTWQDGKQTALSTKTGPSSDSSFTLPNVARVKGNAGITAHIADLFTVSLISNWVGDREVLGSNPYGTVPSYVIANLVISTSSLFNNRVSASLNIRNLLNKTYLDPGLRAGDGAILPTVVEQQGITGLFKVGINF
jgi:outer membrane receptor for ferrienterochelin and colicins